jgi:hypothetical protein
MRSAADTLDRTLSYPAEYYDDYEQFMMNEWVGVTRVSMYNNLFGLL